MAWCDSSALRKAGVVHSHKHAAGVAMSRSDSRSERQKWGGGCMAIICYHHPSFGSVMRCVRPRIKGADKAWKWGTWSLHGEPILPYNARNAGTCNTAAQISSRAINSSAWLVYTLSRNGGDPDTTADTSSWRATSVSRVKTNAVSVALMQGPVDVSASPAQTRCRAPGLRGDRECNYRSGGPLAGKECGQGSG